MILVLDAGNTNITIGVFDDKGQRLLFNLRMKTQENVAKAGYFSRLSARMKMKNIVPADITGCVIGSVVPSITPILSGMIKKYFRITPVVMSSKTKLNIKNAYKNKKEVGDDRLANAAAAGYYFKGKDTLVIDFGTSINFDVINKKGEFLGGMIMPGINMSIDSLYSKTARLPNIEMKYPKRVIGDTTEKSIQSGLMHSVIGSLNEAISAVKIELKSPQMNIVFTGGEVNRAVLSGLRAVKYTIDPDFTVKGFKIIYDLNTKGKRDPAK